MRIVVDDLSGFEVISMIEDHLAEMRANSPEDSGHAMDVSTLRKPEITFWSVWDGEELAGCGALKEHDPTHAEIKSMRMALAYRGKGVAAQLLRHIMDVAVERGYARVSLETGTGEFFLPAIRLYERHGFEHCGPFAHYTNDPYSVYMTKVL